MGITDLFGLGDLSEDCIEMDPPVINSRSTKNVSEFEVLTYPNPTQNELNISLTNDHRILHWQVFSLSGTLIKENKNLDVSEVTISLKDLKSGMYLLKLRNETNSWQSKKIAVVK